MITVKVRKGNLHQALKTLKDCVYICKMNRYLERARHYQKPSDLRRAKRARAIYGQRVRQRILEEIRNR